MSDEIAKAKALRAPPKEIVDYIAQYGGRCRDCGDENGACPHTGLACGEYRTGIKHVLSALIYGVQNGYIKLPAALTAYEKAGASPSPAGGMLGELAEIRARHADACANVRDFRSMLEKSKEENAALSSENATLRGALEEGRRAIGDHFAPNDCYATGPLTGDPIRDLVECPACSFIAKYERVRAALKETTALSQKDKDDGNEK